MTTHVNELFWAKYAGRELTLLERARFQRHVRSCPACSAARQRVDAEKASFDAAPERVAELADLVTRVSSTARPRPRWAIPLFATSAACAALCAVLLWPHGKTHLGLKAKGNGVFVVYVKRAGTVAVLGQRCAPGDLVRFHYETDHDFLTVAERDPTGEVSVLVPPGDEAPKPLSARQGETDGSWRLDDSTGVEHFYAAFSNRPIAREEIISAVVAAGDGEPQIPGASVQAVMCRKERD